MADGEEGIDDLSDGQPGPDKEPKSSKAWMTMITDAEKVFADYHQKADNIDKLYADLGRLASTTRDRQFQLFWANVQVLLPSTYSRPPVPVVVPRFKDRKPLPRVTSELLERSTIVTFELEKIDAVMRLIRDDLIIAGRGVPWLRYETKGAGDKFTERVRIEHVDRKDFLHDPARTWPEVDWVAKASYLTKKEMRKRFKKTSGEVYKDAAYEDRKDEETDDGKLKAKVHEVWSKSQNKVVWVSEGCEKLLDEGPPHLTLDDFFPCPPPAYSTVERRTLKPVPDMVFYKDQLEEINELTARIGALTDAVKVRGFYPAGAGEIGDAIKAAVKSTTDNQVLIPISNWAMIGSGGVKDMIVWLPLEMIAKTIKELVALRKELIDDVYQITGLSDIMRGSTVASETLGAQELKSQYGSTRIKDRQAELVRVARDITRIAAEIMAENFQPKTLLEMSQLEIETDAQCKASYAPLEQQIAQITQQIQQAQTDPEIMAMAQQQPDKAKEVIGQAQQQIGQLQQQIAKLKEKPTVEKVMAFLRDQKLRPFVLDIETDSTIAPDENATKQRATEFLTAIGGFMREALPLSQTVPQAAPLMGETLKFAASQFRAGRPLEGAIEEFADQMKQAASQPKPPAPEQIKAETDAKNAQLKAVSDAKAAEADAAEKHAGAQKTVTESQSKAADDDLARRTREQEAFDASSAKNAELESKKTIGAIQIDQLNAKGEADAQAHAQAMEIGELNIRLLKTKIGQAKVSNDNEALGVDAETPASDGESEDNPKTALDVLVDTLAAQQEILAGNQQALLAIEKAMIAPKDVVHGPDGRIAGIEIRQ